MFISSENQSIKTRNLSIFSKNFPLQKTKSSSYHETLGKRLANKEYFENTKRNKKIISRHHYECYEERLGNRTEERVLLSKIYNWSLKNYTEGGEFQTKVSVKYLTKVIKKSDSTIRNYLKRLVDNDYIEVTTLKGEECMNIYGYRQNLKIIIKHMPKDHEETFEEVFGKKFIPNFEKKGTDIGKDFPDIGILMSEMPNVSEASEGLIYNKNNINNNINKLINYSKNDEEDEMESDNDEISNDVSDECIEAKEFRMDLMSLQGIPWNDSLMKNNVKIELHEINYKKALVLKFKNEDLIDKFKASYYKIHSLILKYNVKFGKQWQTYEGNNYKKNKKPYWKSKQEDKLKKSEYKRDIKLLDDKPIIDSDVETIISSIEESNESDVAKEFKKFAVVKYGIDFYASWIKDIQIQETDNTLYLTFRSSFIRTKFNINCLVDFERHFKNRFDIECLD